MWLMSLCKPLLFYYFWFVSFFAPLLLLSLHSNCYLTICYPKWFYSICINSNAHNYSYSCEKLSFTWKLSWWNFAFIQFIVVVIECSRCMLILHNGHKNKNTNTYNNLYMLSKIIHTLHLPVLGLLFLYSVGILGIFSNGRQEIHVDF